MSIVCGFTGILSADAVKRQSKNGKDWVSLSVKVGNGPNTQWINTSVFGNDVANVADLKAGASIYIEGTIELRRWENHAGHKMAGLSAVATFCRPIDLRAKSKREGNAS